MKAEESSTQLKKDFTLLRSFQLLCVIAIALALCVYGFNKWLAVPFLALALVFRFLFQRRKKTYTRSLLHLSAGQTLAKHLEKSEHLEEAPVSSNELRSVRMLPCDSAAKGVTCAEGGKGFYHGREVVLTSAAFSHTYTPERAQKTNYTVGTWVRVSLPADTGLDCRFLSRRTVPAQSLKEMLWIESDLKVLENPPEIKDVWQIVCAEGKEMLPPKGFLRQLDKVFEKTEGKIAVCVQGSFLYFMLEDALLAQEVSIRVAPDKCVIPDLLPALSHGLRLADFL